MVDTIILALLAALLLALAGSPALLPPRRARFGAVAASVALLAIVVLPRFVFAQDIAPGDKPIDSKLQFGVSVYEMLSPVLIVLVGWIAKKLSDWLGAHTKNAAVAGILTRMNDQVWTLVKDANQTLANEIRKAKDPKSPGGKNLTADESARIKSAVLANFKSLWGAKGMAEAATVLGLGGESGVMDLVAKKIEAAVHDLGKESGPGPS